MRPGKAIEQGRSTGRPCIAFVLALTLLLAGCGTDVRSLLGKESKLAWDAHQLALAAADLEPGLENPLYDAGEAKQEACQPIDRSVIRAIERSGGLSFGEQFVSDLSRLVVFVFPIGFVERCAEAHDDFEQEFVTLNDRLEEFDITANDL